MVDWERIGAHILGLIFIYTVYCSWVFDVLFSVKSTVDAVLQKNQNNDLGGIRA